MTDGAKRRITFNTIAEKYHARRPTYPPELFNKLIKDTHLQSDAKLLEIGPGTGQATTPLAERGYEIIAIELGAEMAAKARLELAKYPKVTVSSGAFEDVPLPANYFDMVYSATAIHWVPIENRFSKPRQILKPNGYLAIIHTEHASDEAGDAFFHACDPIYFKYRSTGQKGDEQVAFQPPKLSDLQPPENIDNKLFHLESFTVFPTQVTYSSQEYVELLGTFSPQLVMPAAKRQNFLQEIKALIDKDFDGHITKHYGMTLTIAKKINIDHEITY